MSKVTERVHLTFFREPTEATTVLVTCDADEQDLMIGFMQSYGLTFGYLDHLD
jgi:hypothetical protein